MEWLSMDFSVPRGWGNKKKKAPAECGEGEVSEVQGHYCLMGFRAGNFLAPPRFPASIL